MKSGDSSSPVPRQIRFAQSKPVYDPASRTVRFAALREDHVLVVCAIASQSIKKIFGLSVISPEQMLSLYQRHRTSFELLARCKYRLRCSAERVVIAPEDVPALGTEEDR